ncbi:hypothetical protein E8E13_005650 [Curvularia kusanoi]|uniref:Heterokaryon incompatibility domain-containing protein n=1 Tax=Curvularia kusanoi TaxID=90978 RepID=A0A9P4TAD2_CURKU|nr:hypothetical protein E8E13_005650 [Curvularia kusanoi]
MSDRDRQPGQLIADYFLGMDIARRLLAFCTDPYWSRVWIVQEIFLAKSVRIQYADSRLDNIDQLCSRIQSISTWMKPGEQIHNCPGHEHLSEILESPAARLLAKRRTWQTPDNRRFVIPWDSGFGTLGCADVRDRVYAMSALMDPKLAIIPDYSKSASELFESIFEEHLKRNSTFSGPIWNLQSMFELDDKDPVIQRAKQHGSPEWLSTGTLAAYGRTMAINDIDRSSSASRAYQGSDDDALARMRAEWSEQTRRRRAAKERSARALKSGQ